jgi:hypothetical protein
VHQKRMGGESAKQVATTGLSEPERGSRPFDASTGRERAPRGDEKRRDAPLRLVPTRANTQPAFGRLSRSAGTDVAVSTDRQTRIA